MAKSAFCTRIATVLKAGHPDAHLYVDLRGQGETPLSPGEALGSFMRALGVEGPNISAAAEDWALMYRTMLAAGNSTMFLDNAGDERQIRSLILGAPGSITLITGDVHVGRKRITRRWGDLGGAGGCWKALVAPSTTDECEECSGYTESHCER